MSDSCGGVGPGDVVDGGGGGSGVGGLGGGEGEGDGDGVGVGFVQKYFMQKSADVCTQLVEQPAIKQGGLHVSLPCIFKHL